MGSLVLAQGKSGRSQTKKYQEEVDKQDPPRRRESRCLYFGRMVDFETDVFEPG